MKYNIVRCFLVIGKQVLIKKGLSAKKAILHCKSLETSSATAKSKKAKELTNKYGNWIDVYIEQQLIKPASYKLSKNRPPVGIF